MFENVKCNGCGADETTLLFEAGVAQKNRIVKCVKCGLIYANPRGIDPQHAVISAVTSLVDIASVDSTNNSRIEKESLQVRDYSDTREALNRLYPDRGVLLEIGSGFGYLISAFQSDGWTTIGIDPDKIACDHAKSTLHVDARHGVLETVGIPESSVDVVIMNHVIEHVPDPHGLLVSLFKALKPGGHLVVETPRYDTLMFAIFGKLERSLSCDGHIYFFTTKTLRDVSTAAGFEVINMKPVGRSLTVNRLAGNIGYMSKSPAVKKVLDVATRRLGLHKVNIYLNARDMQRALLHKPASQQETGRDWQGAAETSRIEYAA